MRSARRADLSQPAPMYGVSRTLADAQCVAIRPKVVSLAMLILRHDATLRVHRQKGCWMFRRSGVRRLLCHHAQQNGRIAMAI
jgi:hypothetical protein